MSIPGPGQQLVGSSHTLLTGTDGSVVQRTVLPGGIRVVTEFVSSARSVSLGFWVGVGSRDEDLVSAGASHFLEHLLFKGTDRRTAFEISAQIESVGGDLNAFTTKECTCYHARVLADDVDLAADVLADMVTNSLIAEADFEAERQVVLEELARNEDDPSDVARLAFAAAIYGSSPLARPVIGSVESLRKMSRDTVLQHYRQHYRPAALVVTAAGAVDHDRLTVLVREVTAKWVEGHDSDPLPPRVRRDVPQRIATSPGRALTNRPTEQAHIVLGVPGLSRIDERRWALAVLDVALGGGMSSRLFQEVRERRGLAYAVATFRSGYSDAGVLGVYAGTHPERADETIDVIRAILAQAAQEGLAADELDRAKGQLRGASVLETEDIDARMSRLGEAEVLSGQYLSVDEVISKVDAVTSADVADIASEILTGPQTLSVVGPYEPDRIFGSE